MSHRTLLPGRAYRFLYPSINFKCLPSNMIERRVVVQIVKDMETERTDDGVCTLSPFVNRGRWLVTGMDLEKFQERSFYVESMTAVMEITDQVPEKLLALLQHSFHERPMIERQIA